MTLVIKHCFSPLFVSLVSFLSPADCEIDGYLSPSGFQDGLDAALANVCSPSTPPSNLATPPITPTSTPPMPLLRFPSVSAYEKSTEI